MGSKQQEEKLCGYFTSLCFKKGEGDIVLHEITSKGCFIQAIKTKYVFETLHSPNILVVKHRQSQQWLQWFFTIKHTDVERN